MPNVRFGILPLGVPLSAIPQGPCVLYVGEEVTAAIENFAEEGLYRGADAAACLRAVDRLWEKAVEGESARRLLTEAVDALRAAAAPEFDNNKQGL
jgi:hypothetical protein